LPSLAAGSEVWMGISLSMSEVIRLQEASSVLRCAITVKDKTGREHECMVSLPKMPVVTPMEYQMAQENELVARRFNEIESADVQRVARTYVQDRNWTAVEGLIQELEVRSQDNPWLRETVKYLRKLLEQRDHETMEKELMYASSKLKNRVASLNDSVMYCMEVEASEPAYLRKKVAQGRNADSQTS
jgi:Ca-activated chloride channel family protein